MVFETGTPVEHDNALITQRVSGIFAVEVMGVRTIGGKRRITNDSLWGIVLSEKEVAEFFSTGKIANYSGFDFSGLNDIISAKG